MRFEISFAQTHFFLNNFTNWNTRRNTVFNSCFRARFFSAPCGISLLFRVISEISIVKGIITVKFDEWQKQIQVFNKEYDVLSPVTEKTTETVNNTVDETGNNNTVDSSVTFNNGDFGNDTKQQRDSTGNRQETGTKTVVKNSLSGGVPVSEIIQKEMSLRKTNFKTQVIAELAKELTVDIY